MASAPAPAEDLLEEFTELARVALASWGCNRAVWLAAFALDVNGTLRADDGGELAFRIRGETHVWTPETITGLQHAVREGSFENFEGEVDSVEKQKGMVTVLLTIFGRATPVDVEYWQLEKL